MFKSHQFIDVQHKPTLREFLDERAWVLPPPHTYVHLAALLWGYQCLANSGKTFWYCSCVFLVWGSSLALDWSLHFSAASIHHVMRSLSSFSEQELSDDHDHTSNGIVNRTRQKHSGATFVHNTIKRDAHLKSEIDTKSKAWSASRTRSERDRNEIRICII